MMVSENKCAARILFPTFFINYMCPLCLQFSATRQRPYLFPFPCGYVKCKTLGSWPCASVWLLLMLLLVLRLWCHTALSITVCQLHRWGMVSRLWCHAVLSITVWCHAALSITVCELHRWGMVRWLWYLGRFPSLSVRTTGEGWSAGSGATPHSPSLSASQVKSSHLYLYSAFNNTNCVKATAQYQNRNIF